ncbi:hypothetical protein MHU86_14601 [Fragilaria crotonensis]|nr:hypothetical protein MHU86_14601 [Fragilaria crotonensis]
MSEDGTISEQGGSADMSRRKWRAPSSGAGSINLSLEEPTNGLLYEDELLWGDDPNKHYFEYIMNKHERNSSEGANSGNLGQAVFAPPLLIDNATPLDASSAHPTPAPADPATGSSYHRQTRKDAEQLKTDPFPLAIDTNNARETLSSCYSLSELLELSLVAMILAKQLPSKGSQQQAVDPTSSISASVASGSESPSSIPAVLPSESPSIPAVLPSESPSIPAVLPPESPSIPAVLPSESPSIVASWQPSAVKSKGPSESPTEEPTVQPATPTPDPTPTPNNTTAAPSLPKSASPTAKDDTSVPSSSPSTDMPFIATPNETTSPTVTNNTVMPPSSPPTDMPFNASPSETTSPTTTTPSAPVALTDDTVGLQTPLPSQQETVTAPSASLGPEAFGTRLQRNETQLLLRVPPRPL